MLSPVGDAATERSAAGKRFLDAQAAQMKADDAASPRDCRADLGGPQAGDRHPVPISRSTAAASLVARPARPVFNASSPVPALGASNPIAVALAA